MKGAAIVMIFYSVSMVFYGAIEIAHDLLHYLADHHHSSLHGHYHDQRHSIQDHANAFWWRCIGVGKKARALGGILAHTPSHELLKPSFVKAWISFFF
jgi:hypothetical protein